MKLYVIRNTNEVDKEDFRVFYSSLDFQLIEHKLEELQIEHEIEFEIVEYELGVLSIKTLTLEERKELYLKTIYENN